MKTHPYEYNGYDIPIARKPQQNSVYTGNNVAGRMNQQPMMHQAQRLPQGEVAMKPKLPKPMPKQRALALVHTLKKGIVVASLATFVSFSGLAAFHQIGTAANATSSQVTSSSTSSTQKNSKNFLKQQGGNKIGSTTSSKGTSSSSTSSTSSTGSTQGTSSSSTSSSSSSTSAVSGSNVS